MGVRTNNLLEEILANARKDRKAIEAVRDGLLDLTKMEEVQAESMHIISIAENIAKLSDVLTKVNGQLVELSKVTLKTDNPQQDAETEKDSIFDEIEGAN